MLKGLGIFVALIFGLVAYYLYHYALPVYTYRYRLTVDVAVDGKVVSGSTVREISNRRPYHRSIDGEAAIVDLGQRGVLFATLYDDDLSNVPTMMAEHVFRRAFKLPQNYTPPEGQGNQVEIWRQITELKDCAELTPRERPLLLRFRDLKVPASVERVDPLNLAASFGPGVSLRAITICVVDDPASRIVNGYLPWLGSSETRLANMPGRPLPVDQAPFNARMQHGAFIVRPRK